MIDVLPDQEIEETVDDGTRPRCCRVGTRNLLGFKFRTGQCKSPAEWSGKFSICGHAPIEVCNAHLCHKWGWRCGDCRLEGQAIVSARRIA